MPKSALPMVNTLPSSVTTAIWSLPQATYLNTCSSVAKTVGSSKLSAYVFPSAVRQLPFFVLPHEYNSPKLLMAADLSALGFSETISMPSRSGRAVGVGIPSFWLPIPT